MMAQYLAIKEAHPDSLLFYRMGDFYEMFFDDAVAASAALDITLTRRGRHGGEDIPMCGVPVHSAEAYLARLIRKGFRVAVCEQTENPAEAKKRGAKSVVARDVIRIVTPGTLTEDALLNAERHNYLAALGEAQGQLGLAWLDISSGEFFAQPVTPAALPAALARIEPNELLLPERLLQKEGLAEPLSDWKAVLAPLPASRFDSEAARRRLEAAFAVAALDGFGAFGRAEISACGALVDYVELTQKGRLPRLNAPKRLAQGSTMEIDAATRRNLELTRTLSGEREGSLLSVVDFTVTGPGSRLLAERLAAPLCDPEAVAERLDAVGFLAEAGDMRAGIRERLRAAPDIARALSRLMVERGGPRDAAAIREGLAAGHALRALLDGLAEDRRPPPELARCAAGMGRFEALCDRLARALRDELPPNAREGGFIAPGYSARLDELLALRDDSRRLIADLQGRYAAETGIAGLKIRHNNVLGYYIEVTRTHADRIDTGAESPFIHRQTMSNAVRFTTVELGELEGKISRAADQAVALEAELFADLIADISPQRDDIARAAAALATLDVAAALAELAVVRRYARPKVDSSFAFSITAGRHPVVEAALAARREGGFVPNGCDLAPETRLWLLTGPNMAGKSTFLRQNALIAILAQAGSFVPAESAHIGVVDRLFSRVGAADDLARGRSTFMVEMVETAAILNQSGPRALVILDEIGRGTATFDGLSIAWATLEHLHENNGCRALFATHYHELTALAARLERLTCHTMRVKEWQGDVVFLHEVAAGAADRSYGIHVGRLAGLPAAVIARAEEVLEALERGQQGGAVARLADDLPLFSATAARPPPAAAPAPAVEALAELDPDAMTPREALEALYRLRALLKDGAGQ
ncbi:MAG: DNA mismatch repair protein MutS [Alphaproteobacteria bacterium]|nr:DNA mismatch repair protein MutS [Alphaproteobacteria bacterium]